MMVGMFGRAEFIGEKRFWRTRYFGKTDYGRVILGPTNRLALLSVIGAAGEDHDVTIFRVPGELDPEGPGLEIAARIPQTQAQLEEGLPLGTLRIIRPGVHIGADNTFTWLARESVTDEDRVARVVRFQAMPVAGGSAVPIDRTVLFESEQYAPWVHDVISGNLLVLRRANQQPESDELFPSVRYDRLELMSFLTGKLQRTIELQDPVEASMMDTIEIHPAGERLLLRIDQQVRLVDGSGKTVAQTPDLPRPISKLSISPDAKHMAIRLLPEWISFQTQEIKTPERIWVYELP
jgi:hypothetical protein